MSKAVKKSAFLIEAESKPVTPVDTGRLRASISSQIMPLTATIAPHTDYAIYVHEGTYKMRERPFMGWGTEKAKPHIERFFEQAVKTAILK